MGWEQFSNNLKCTCLVTCSIGLRFIVEMMWMPHAGLVFAAGSHITGWDPRQNGNATSPSPAFIVKYEEGTKSHHVNTMISAGLAECNAPSQLLTGVLPGNPFFHGVFFYLCLIVVLFSTMDLLWHMSRPVVWSFLPYAYAS